MIPLGILASSVRGTTGTANDPHWDKVVALLRFDGDSNDETGRVWSMLPGTAIDTTSPIYGTGSLRCAGLDHGCETINPIDDTTVDFTIECTVEFTALPGPVNPEGGASTWLWAQPQNGPNGEFGVRISAASAPLIFLDLRGGTNGLQYPSDPPGLVPGQKYHFAHTFEDGVHRLFLDGKKVIEANVSIGWKNTNLPFAIGRSLIPSASTWRGGSFAKFDEFRITKGVARYTEDFTPPSEPFPNQ